MLVMKLRANRPGRDTRDIRLLLALCDVQTLEDVGDLYEQFYPGDILTPRAEKVVTAILDGEPTTAPDSPGPIDISSVQMQRGGGGEPRCCDQKRTVPRLR